MEDLQSAAKISLRVKRAEAKERMKDPDWREGYKLGLANIKAQQQQEEGKVESVDYLPYIIMHDEPKTIRMTPGEMLDPLIELYERREKMRLQEWVETAGLTTKKEASTMSPLQQAVETGLTKKEQVSTTLLDLMNEHSIIATLKSIMTSKMTILLEVLLLLIIIGIACSLAMLYDSESVITPIDTNIILPCYRSSSSPTLLMCSTKNIRGYETTFVQFILGDEHEIITLHNDQRKEKSDLPTATPFSATMSKQVSPHPTSNAKEFTTFGDSCPIEESSNTEKRHEHTGTVNSS